MKGLASVTSTRAGLCCTYHTNAPVIMTLDSQSGVISVDGRAAVVWHLCEAVEAPQLIVGPGSS